MSQTITEALAEIKTIQKRLESKRKFVTGYLYRQEHMKDPLEKDGGSSEAIFRERQSIHDLQKRIVSLRRAINDANESTVVSIASQKMTIAEWLIWRREVFPAHRNFLANLLTQIQNVRTQARAKGINVLTVGSITTQRPDIDDVIVNVDEGALNRELEELQIINDELDGILSLKNATTVIADV